MATQILPLGDCFPRHHRFCDRCDGAITGNAQSGEVQTAAGSFRYCFCGDCCDARHKMSVAARSASMRRALIRHGQRYSPKLGEFIAEWFGMRTPTRALLNTNAETTRLGQQIGNANQGACT